MNKKIKSNGNELFVSSLEKSFENLKNEEGYNIYLRILKDLGKE